MHPDWKQPTPLMQLRAIVAAMEGSTSNWCEDITDDFDYSVKSKRFSDQLVLLLPHLEAGHWIV